MRADTFLGQETRGVINIWAELLILIFFLFILSVNWVLNRKLGNSIASLPFIYIMAGLTLMESARILIFLYELNVYDIEDNTLQLWWHFLFYLAMALFFLAIRQVSKRTKASDLRSFGNQDITIVSSFFLVGLLTFLTPELVNDKIKDTFNGSFLDNSGFVHFVAFLLAGLLAVQMLKVRSNAKENDFGKYIASIVPSFILFLTIMSLNHFWELLTESWGILAFDESVIETGEQLFWVFGFLVMAFGYYSLLRSVSGSVQESNLNINSITSPVVIAIFNVLSDHLGTFANSVAIKSSQDIGLRLEELSRNNITAYGNAVENNTKDLIGIFPSKFLNQSIQKRVISI